MDSNAPVLQAAGLGKRFASGNLDVTVLAKVDLEARRGDSLGIIGADGSGKSTLLHVLGGLEPPTAGTVRLHGRDLGQLDREELARVRKRHIAFMYKLHYLLPEFSLLDNVTMHMWTLGERAHMQQHAMEALEAVGLARRAAFRPAELSPLQRQLGALARAVAGRPDCVLADEPEGELDEESASDLYDHMAALARAHGMAFVVATRNDGLAARLGRCRQLQHGTLG
ncbi:MAG: ATP-binding cassette domain-containing protein [Burkholderiales bacterium]|nr:ATP-binding cassette domain-containing protein [Burkholderiales bacterium]